MDNLCHTLVGAAFGEAGLKRRTRLGNATLMIAANIPDLDVLVFATDTPSVAFRRGWTHGVLAQTLLPIVLTAVMMVVVRLRPARANDPPVDARWLLLLSYVGVLSHVGLDLLNNYGIRLLMPFDRRWFYGDTLFIMDPWMWLVLGAGVWLARRQQQPWPARGALVTAGAYVVLMALSAHAARTFVLDAWVAANRTAPRALMVGPMPMTPFSRAVIIDAGERYATGTFTWWPQEARFDPRSIPKNAADPLVAAARTAPNIAAFLVWSRFPFWTLEPTRDGARVTVHDLRFSARGGRFEASTQIPTKITETN